MSKTIKVCHIANADMAIRFLLLEQLKFLKKEGYKVFAVCSGGKWIKDIENQGVKVKIVKFKRKIFSPVSDLVALIKLVVYFKKEKFDIVHTHTPKAGFLGQLAAKLVGIPIVINTLHGFSFAQNTPYFKKKFLIFLERITAKFSDLILSVSQRVIDTAIKEKICPSQLIKYLGRDIDIERFNPARFNEEFILEKKKQLGVDPKKKVIGIVARLVAEKGYRELFEAFKMVLEKFPEIIILSVGAEEPEKKDAINKNIVKKYGIEGKVIFLGERADVDEIYPLMDIFVLPTYREGIGGSILEASAMERPIITNDIVNCREAVENGKTGILVKTNTPEEIFKAIIYIFSNQKKAKEMARHARGKIKKEFNQQIVFMRLSEIYSQLINKMLLKNGRSS